MNARLIPIAVSLLAAVATARVDDHAARGPKEGTVLQDPKSGAAVTLPADWSFATDEHGLLAGNEDGSAMVALASAEKDFETLRTNVQVALVTRLDQVAVARTTVVAADELGGFEELVVSEGQGVSRRDGKPVRFSALVVRSGDAGGLILGAWKTEAAAKTVESILDTLRVETTAGKGGLVLTNAATGATITIPKGWATIADRKALLTVAPERGGMALILRWAGDFETSVAKAREVLTGWVFKDITLGEFAIVEAAYDKTLGEVIAADGKAVDVVDEKPVEFNVLRMGLPQKDEGALIFGAWKDEKHAKAVEEMLMSIKLGKPEAKGEMKK